MGASVTVLGGAAAAAAAAAAKKARDARLRAARARRAAIAKKKKDCKNGVKPDQKEKLRKASPGKEQRTAAQKTKPKRCPVCRGTDPPGFLSGDGGFRPGQALEAEHVVPFEEIVKMKGFGCLSEKKQLKILNDPKNLSVMCKSCNSSKRERGLDYMLGKGGREGVKYPKPGMDYLKQQQASIAGIKNSLSGKIGSALL